MEIKKRIRKDKERASAAPCKEKRRIIWEVIRRNNGSAPARGEKKGEKEAEESTDCRPRIRSYRGGKILKSPAPETRTKEKSLGGGEGKSLDGRTLSTDTYE